jgi:hypothetical protein
MADIHITGLKELQAFLDTLPAKIEKNVMRGALRAGAVKELLPEAQANLMSNGSVVTGELISGLKVVTQFKNGKVIARVLSKHVNEKGIPDNLPLWVEYGTKAHFISVQENEKPINYRLSARRMSLVRASMTTVNRNVLKIGANFIGPTVHHPGAKPKPFLRPALDRSGGAAVVAAAEYMKARLESKHGLDTADIEIGEV